MTSDHRRVRSGRVRRLLLAVLAACAIVGGVIVAPAAQPQAEAADLSKFNPGNIISDAVFFNNAAMTQAQIQSFLVAKVPTCAVSASSNPTCLKDYYVPTSSKAADAMCGAYSGGGKERASAIIFKVAQACGVNPQVILVMLQKEQGLVTSVWPSEYGLNHAMGANCPDTTGCDTKTGGFFTQVYTGVWQLKRYANPAGTSKFFTWYAPGKTWNILYSPNTSCGRKSVTIANQATANLYYYTPYTPNNAALKAGYGTGDSCSSYGNRNFYNYFTDWFGSTQAVADVCAAPTGSSVVAAAGEYKVNVASLNARQAPTTVCADGVVALPQGTIVTRTGTFGTWWRVRLDSKVYWVSSEYLVATTPVKYKTSRVAGADRYATAAAIARQTNPTGAATVYLASGENFPDALSGSAIAARDHAALLLTGSGSLPAATATALTSLKPTKVVILGGESAITPAVQKAVSTLLGSTVAVTRIAGTSRYSTTLSIAAAWTTAPTVYIATGRGYVDAISASAVAAAVGAPMILVDGAQATLSDAALQALVRLRTTKVVVAGGTAVVSAGIATQLAGKGIAVDRKAGVNRYDTSRLLATALYPSTAAQVYLASGENFPDALTGSVLAGERKAPLFTQPRTCMTGAVKDYMIGHGTTASTLVGGPDAITDAVLTSTRC